MNAKEIKQQLNTMPLSNLKSLFVRHFEVNHLCLDLMDEVPQNKLRKFMADNFIKDFSEEELTHIITVEQFEVTPANN